MRFTLIDLLIAIACVAAGFLAGSLPAHWAGHPHLRPLFGIPLGVLAYLTLTPPVYRRFRLRPLLVPRCPHCRTLPERYGVVASEWPREVVFCSSCRGLCELQYRPGAARLAPDPAVPRLVLGWPQSVGVSRVVPPPQP
jgi:LSD1 subclass zinc finger protein